MHALHNRKDTSAEANALNDRVAAPRKRKKTRTRTGAPQKRLATETPCARARTQLPTAAWLDSTRLDRPHRAARTARQPRPPSPHQRQKEVQQCKVSLSTGRNGPASGNVDSTEADHPPLVWWSWQWGQHVLAAQQAPHTRTSSIARGRGTTTSQQCAPRVSSAGVRHGQRGGGAAVAAVTPMIVTTGCANVAPTTTTGLCGVCVPGTRVACVWICAARARIETAGINPAQPRRDRT